MRLVLLLAAALFVAGAHPLQPTQLGHTPTAPLHDTAAVPAEEKKAAEEGGATSTAAEHGGKAETAGTAHKKLHDEHGRVNEGCEACVAALANEEKLQSDAEVEHKAAEAKADTLIKSQAASGTLAKKSADVAADKQRLDGVKEQLELDVADLKGKLAMKEAELKTQQDSLDALVFYDASLAVTAVESDKAAYEMQKGVAQGAETAATDAHKDVETECKGFDLAEIKKGFEPLTTSTLKCLTPTDTLQTKDFDDGKGGTRDASELQESTCALRSDLGWYDTYPYLSKSLPGFSTTCCNPAYKCVLMFKPEAHSRLKVCVDADVVCDGVHVKC